MGFFNQSLAQMRELFASMTPAARITSALLLGVIVVSLGYLFQGYADSSEELLFNGEILEPREADRVEAAIAQANLPVLDRQAGRIVVPRGRKAEYLAAIADAGALPANFHTLLEESLDTGLFENGETKKARFKAARERQLSMLVSEMTGVDDAKVLYDIRESKAFGKEKITATVSVLPAAGATLDALRIKMIRQAIAMAIAGLDPADVMVLDRTTGSQFGGGSEVMAASFETPYFREQTTYEQRMKARIENLLSYIKPGVQVQVSAELDDTLKAETRTVKAEGEGATVHERKEEQESKNLQTEDKGQPGLNAQGPNRTPADQAVAKNENSETSTTTDTQNFVPTTEEMRQQTGLTPRTVRATIAVPSEYLVRVWRETTPNITPDTKPDPTLLEKIEDQVQTKIKELVAPLFPKEVAEDQLAKVEVTVFQSLTPDPIEEPSMASQGILWASRHSGSLLMAGLAVVCLLMLRSMIKSIPTADKTLTFATAALSQETVGEAAAATLGKSASRSDGAAATRDGGRPRLRLKKGPTLKDDLTELVKEDPDGAAAILRTWIGNAG
jgi:flagellar M-ring protein FliF